jgi:hypothetical protein
MTKLTSEMRIFLRTLIKHNGAATSSEAVMATREADLARQTCRKEKLAFYDHGYWLITDVGRETLTEDVKSYALKRGLHISGVQIDPPKSPSN